MTNNFRALCSEMLQAFDDYFRCPIDASFKPFAEARAALAEPVGEGPSDELVDDLFNRFADSCDEYGLWSMGKDGLRAALARWGRPAAPPAPEPGEVGELVAALGSKDRWTQLTDVQVDRAATLLQQQAAPAPVVVPVPVGERLPGEGDCDARGRCWVWWKNGVRWVLDEWTPADFQSAHLKDAVSHWLPAHAIPLPQAGEGMCNY